MFSGRGEVPWHKLGTVVQGTLTSAEAIKVAGLDWPVVKHPIFARIPGAGLVNEFTGKQTGSFKRVDSLFATVRTDRNVPLGVVGSKYVPISNADLFSCLDGLVDDGAAQYETAGSLGAGETVWMLLVAGENLKVAGDDVRPYVLARGAHDGSGCVRIRPVTTRVVCANTLACAMGEKVSREYSIRHTANSKDKLAEAAQALGILRESRVQFAITAEALLAKTFSRSDMEALTRALIGERPLMGALTSDNRTFENQRELNSWDKRFETIMHDAWGAPDLANVKGTAWGAFNAITDYEQHLVRMKGTELQKLETAFVRATSTGPLARKAFDILTA
jgi:phage/plasmid-like protein (TIGR03299 family)